MAAIQKVLKLLFGVGDELRRIIPVMLHMPLTGACICAPHPSLYAEASAREKRAGLLRFECGYEFSAGLPRQQPERRKARQRRGRRGRGC